ncbi:heavy metal-binding domain-containing protein [Candidatus Igneacidithiobacillus taiwanensis]|uniref:heavy metal-binding domain-containing protein n=1 Tax=Candidatus Igneacidithiobacillus taiwanensis TaxID=1945924 RepID=UPI0028992EF5|nr:heavy metal-binding domain-containing protein [Candidatus Igneacidithiobacillus taiwanensis]
MTQETLAPHAVERLRGLRSQGSHEGIFTSDLSVNEFVMVRKAQFEPLGLVVGSCIYHMGIQYGSWNQNMEMDVLSQAMYQARELAMSRMEQEAILLQADGVVGVRLEVKRMDWDQDILEFMAIGTAIAHRSGAPGFKGVGGKPFTSDLSGQDFWMLLQAGYRPMEMVMGSCVYHVAHQGVLRSMGNIGRNIELEQFTQAMYDARELAMERMQREAADAQADGITGVQLHEGSHNWQPHVIEFFAVGTAVKAMDNADAQVDAMRPQLVLPVND